MSVEVSQTRLPGVLLVQPRVFGDDRGYFFESWRSDHYAAAGVPERFVQDNVSRSARGVLRGLHVQWPFPQGKLVQVLEGEVFDVAVDVRVGSATFGQWVGYRLTSGNHHQLYLPPGVAHGFCVTSHSALVTYKCTEFYHPETEVGIAWNDRAIAIDWPVSDPSISSKDASAPVLAALQGKLPVCQP